MVKPALQIKSLSKSFGKIEVLHDINLSISKGDVYGLIGQNGAGKTTLLRLVSGLMKPTGGSIKLHTEKRFIGYMPQSCRFDDRNNVADTIRLFAFLRKVDTEKSILLCKKLELDTTKKVKHLSPGQQKKLQMIIAMAGEPDLYILDEPTAGLDPNATFEMKNVIQEIHQSGKSIIISSHILQDMDEICTNVAIMENGQLTYDNEIVSSFLIKTEPIANELLKRLKQKYIFTSNDTLTIHNVQVDKIGVSELIKKLSLESINIYEVSASNMKNIVQEKMHLEKREG